MTHRIVKLPPADVADGPAVGIAEVAAGASPEQRARRLLPPDRIPAHSPLVLLWRGDRLSSPDTISVDDSPLRGTTLEVRIALRRFAGDLHVNVVTVPLVEVDLGSLGSGQYEVVLEVSETWFSDLEHPERGDAPDTHRTTFSFTVV